MLKLILLFGYFTTVLCGFGDDLDGRIVGGDVAAIEDYQYTVVVMLHGRMICAGALIDPYWVITSAQCTRHITPAGRLNIRAGSSNHNEGGEVYIVAEIIQHFSFEPDSLDFDVSLLQLLTPVDQYYSKPIGLAEVAPGAGTMVTLAAWGAIAENGDETTIIHEVRIPSVSHSNCEEAYSASGRFITDRMICAGVLGIDGKGICFGDIGAPAVANGVLVGFASWSIGCGRADYPVVFTNIASTSIRGWIVANVGL